MKKLLTTVAAILAIALLTGCPGSPKDNENTGGNSGSGSSSSNGSGNGANDSGGGGAVTQKTIKAAPNAVGDIVLKNGTAIAYYDGLTLNNQEKADAIAVIFYAGGDNELGNRKLGVGLNQESKLWISGPGLSGYHRSNALSETDGLANQDAIEAYNDFTENSGNYPAFYWTDNYDELIPVQWSDSSGFGQNWYIPAKKELKKLLQNRNLVNKALAKISDSADLFKAPQNSSETWWSSTDATPEDASGFSNSDYKVYTITIYDGQTELQEGFTIKQSNNYRMTCAIHAF